MMATQVVPIEVLAPPRQISVREDVQAVLVVATSDGCPVAVTRLPRPPGGVLFSHDVLDALHILNPAPVAHRRSAMAPISIIIPTHERPEDLARCLESLSSARAAGHEVLVVDNGPVTSRTAAVAERFGVRVVTEPITGLNRARNAGVAHAIHEIVAFVDDDVVVNPGWPEAISESFADPSVGCVTGLVLPLELETAGQEEFELYSQHRRDLRSHIYSRRVLRSSAAGMVGIGANMAYRRDLVLALGGFDVRLGPPTYTRAADETDMFARMLDSGRLIVYTPAAYVWHRHRRTQHEVRSCVFGYGVGLYGMLTKRLIEQRDLGALVVAGRWLVGPLVKAARAKLTGRPAPRWSVVLAETAGAVCGPFCFGVEAWRHATAEGRRGQDAHAGMENN